MAQNRRLPMAWTTVVANHESNALTHPGTPYMDATQVKKLPGILEIISRTGGDQGIEVALGYQTANVENNPDTAVALASASPYKDSDGVHYPTAVEDLTTALAGKQLVRFVFMTRNESGGGTTVNFARVCAVIELIDC